MARKRKEDTVTEKVIKVNGRHVVVREGPKPVKAQPKVVEPIKVELAEKPKVVEPKVEHTNSVLEEIEELKEKVEELEKEVSANTDVKVE